MLNEHRLREIGTDMLSFSLGDDSKSLGQFARIYGKCKRWPSQISKRGAFTRSCFDIAKTVLKFRRCKNFLFCEEVSEDVAELLSQNEIDEYFLSEITQKTLTLEMYWKENLMHRILERSMV